MNKPTYLLATTLLAASLSGRAAEVDQARVKELRQQLQVQLGKMPQFETLKQSHENPLTVVPESHVFILRLGDGIEMVTESCSEEGVIVQKDYFLHESQVYAHRVSHQVPCLDGKTKRVSEHDFLLDQGQPIYHTLTTMRVPITTEEPDLSKAREHSLALPVNADGWGAKLTARAFAIARHLRPGAGQFIFADWDQWLLKNAPPEGTGEPETRTSTWLPPAGTTVLPIDHSESPDGMYQIGWGYEKGPVDWSRLAFIEGQDSGRKPVTFSTKLAEGELPPELRNDSIFLMNRTHSTPLHKLGIYYPGERQRFNHDELIAHWSPASTCFVTIATQKWETEGAHIAWIKDGVCSDSQDILKPLEQAAKAALFKSKHPAAKRVKEDAEGFAFTLSNILIEDNGSFEAQIVAQVPKDDLPSGLYEAVIRGVFKPAASADSAELTQAKVTILPPG